MTSDNNPHSLFQPGVGSVSIDAELYSVTTNADVIAFQVAVQFHPDHQFTLPELANRWGLGKPKASRARQELLALGFWAEVRPRLAGGRVGRETRIHRRKFTNEDLRELAASYPVSTRIETAGSTYVVGEGGDLEVVDNSANRGAADRVTANRDTVHRATANRASVSSLTVPPAETPTESEVSAPRWNTEVQVSNARCDQGVIETEVQVSDARCDQGKQDIAPAHTVSQESRSPMHACNDDDVSFMHGEFWTAIERFARVDPPGRSTVSHQLTAAFHAGWSPTSLAAWVERKVRTAEKGRGISSLGGFIISLLKSIPSPGEASVTGPRPTATPPAYRRSASRATPASEHTRQQVMKQRPWAKDPA